ncbi:zinc finger DHHC domain-containing protein, putative [Eimeria maxima]|uniref:Zinc finger DHHC domain-containing protein, putative n=1 Tax=Eimeria maxima TaxID=5804 RepID=U6M5N1_EIMMA|nr:zinc finger DHHC domain-containing protein, putative [Eimeria maxima]CDJ56980.1 zinc finger DHHC domain-containing protein, putative [Eimeria maxima]
MIRAAVVLVGLAVPASARDWLSSENQALKLPVWPTSVEKVLLSEEPTPDDFTEEFERGSPVSNMLPGFTTLENYPNPMINTMACRRWGMEVSYVCDPDHVFSSATLDRIEERLSNIRHSSSHRCVDEYVSYPFAVAIVQELPYGVDANTFATELIDRWGLGHSKCHDGLLLLYVASDGGASLKWYVVLLEAILNAIDSTIFLFRKKGT